MAAGSRTIIALAALIGALALTVGAASAHEPSTVGGGGDTGDPAAGGQQGPKEARIKLRLRGLSRGKLNVGNRFRVRGTLSPFVKGERVKLVVKRGKKVVKRKFVTPKRKAGKSFGRFKMRDRQIKPGRYSIQAIHKRTQNMTFERRKTRRFKVRYPKLRPGNRSSKVQLFNKLLAKKGYVNDRGKRYNGATERAVLAFRKVNKMARKTKATKKIFKMLAKGKGGYKVTHPGSDRHVEVDISRQVMALVDGKKPKEIYHVSTGASATPTYPGTWRFYRKDPGFNSIGMYYSVYYNRGYAIHGYHSVPTYPASHGCTRNPIPNSKHIYDWVNVGMKIHISR